jgi:hypothetical protein
MEPPLYKQENETDPHRIVNTLGIARSYAQMGKINEAIQTYENILQHCSDSTFLQVSIELLLKKLLIIFLIKPKIINRFNILHSF